MKNKGCGTCKIIEKIDFVNKYFADEKGEAVKVLKIQLATEIFDRKGQKRGYMGYRTRDINYCPQCGKKIDESKKKWKM